MNDTDKVFIAITKNLDSGVAAGDISSYRCYDSGGVIVSFFINNVCIRCNIKKEPEIIVDGVHAKFSNKQKTAICQAALNAIDRINKIQLDESAKKIIGLDDVETTQSEHEHAEAKKQNAVMQLLEYIGSEIFRWFPVFMLGAAFGFSIFVLLFLPLAGS